MNRPKSTVADILTQNPIETKVEANKKASSVGNVASDGRNLAFEFEKLYVTEKQDSTPTAGKIEKLITNMEPESKDNIKSAISPTCVIEEGKTVDTKDYLNSYDKSYSSLPTETFVVEFKLHSELIRSLTQGQVNRISIYSVIHEINKEASSMASNDFSVCETSSCVSSDAPSSAVIDEEQWVLAAIASRSKEEMRYRPCPASFAESIGEEERALTGDSTRDENNTGMTPNPLSVLSNSRTQLWKPSRSWWEARSGRNPWIEPKSHNKRWRYLWPMIHYHKFLARCIKKLKRNGVDVKTSFSPLSVFLRDEVCAVSDHLGSISKFSAEEWLNVLTHFDGWASTTRLDEESLRALISKLRLKNLGEPSDIQSPLLRDQIDEQFLRAMAQARLQTNDDISRPKEKCSSNKYSLHPYGQKNQQEAAIFQNHKASNDYHIHGVMNHLVPPTNSVPIYTHVGVPEYHDPYYHDVYHPPMTQPPVQYGSQCFAPHIPYQNNPYYLPDSFIAPQQQVHRQNENEFYPVGSPSYGNTYNNPQLNDSNHTSPYWGHLDSLAITGIASPDSPANDHDASNIHIDQGLQQSSSGMLCGKPLLIRPHYYPNQHAGGVPPSPATQFYNTMSLSPYSYQTSQPKSFKASDSVGILNAEVHQTPVRTTNKLPTSVEVDSETD